MKFVNPRKPTFRSIYFQIHFKEIMQIFSSWACGVIMFTLLVGCPPFWHRKQMVMLRNIMEGKYSFTSPEWADISGTQLTHIFRHSY